MMERIYLDNNATSIMDPQVAELMIDFLKNSTSHNPSSIHTDGRKARGAMEEARSRVAHSLAIDLYKDDLQIIFTSSGTEANNLVIHNFKHLKLFVSATEHVSIIDGGHPDQTIIPVDNNGLIKPEDLTNLLKSHPGTKLVSIMLANNETGVIQDIKSLSEAAHKEGAIFHCDGSQAFGKIKVAFNDLGCDLLTISSHKCGGPVGAAALIAKKNLKLTSLIKGGKQEQGLRAGTENLLAITGFGLAAQHCNEKIKQFEQISILHNEMEQEILNFAPEAIIYGSKAPRLPNTSSIRMPNVKSEEQLIKFDLAGISISAGSACSSGRIASSHVLKAMHVDEVKANEVIRVSLGLNTTKEQIKRFIELWKEIYKK